MSRALITSPVAPIMTKPQALCELADEALCGMEIRLLEPVGDGWYKIETHYRYQGFMHESHFLADDSATEQWAGRPKKIITRFTADVLAEPKVQGGHIITLPPGALVCPIDDAGGAEESGWVKVSLPDGRRGFTRESFLGEYITEWDPADEAQLRQALVKTALSYMGAQYRWGGKTTLGIDCSGLTAMAYMLNGIIIYRDAHIKPDFALREISREQMGPGDLLFFKGHVAMYMGEDLYVHSTGRAGDDGVVINSLNPSHHNYRQDLAQGILQVGSIFVTE